MGVIIRVKCVPQSSGREKEFKKLLKWDNFVKIVDNVIEHEVETISLHGGGEPTLNKKFIECVKYIKDKNIHCSTITNGYRLDDKLIQEMDRKWIRCDSYF